MDDAPARLHSTSGPLSRCGPYHRSVTRTVSLSICSLALAGVVAVGAACAGSDQESPAVEASDATSTVRATIPLGGANQIGIGAGSVWVSDDGAGELVRVDPSSNRVVARIAAGDSPGGVAVGEGGVWVASSKRASGEWSGGTVWRIDPNTNEVVAGIEVSSILVDVAVGEGAVWASNGNHGRFGAVWRIDPETNQLSRSAPIRVGGGPSDVEVAHGSVWVALADDGAVVRIDPTTNEVGAPIRVGAAPFSLAVGAGAVWVLNSNDGTVMRIDPTSGRVTGRAIPVGGMASDLAVAADALWITNGKRVLRIDPVTGEIRDELPVADGPFAVAVGMGSVWVTGNFNGTLIRIDS
jgi:YVTN family beta-propeller protein